MKNIPTKPMDVLPDWAKELAQKESMDEKDFFLWDSPENKTGIIIYNIPGTNDQQMLFTSKQ